MAGLYGKGHLGVRFFRGSMCVEGMGCKRRWVRWVLRGTGTAPGHPGVSRKYVLAISAGSLFPNGTTRIVKVN